MKKIYTLVSIAAVLAAVSCEKETSPEIQVAERGVFSASISDLTKTSLDGSAANKVVWNAGDEVNINGCIYVADTDGATTTFTAKSGETPAASTYTAYYPADLFDGTKASLPRYQNYAGNIARLPMVAVSDNTSLQFKNVCGVMHLVLKGTATVKNIKISNSAVTMADEFTVDESGKAVAASGMYSTIMACGASGVKLSETGTDFYIAMVPGTYKKLAVEITTKDGGYAKFAAKTSSQVIERNCIYKFEFTPEFEPGVLNDWFMVSNKKSVLLADGNLRYNPAANEWRFADNQYDFIHDAKAEDITSEYSGTYDGWIDLFGFGTSGYNSGVTCYQPWSTSATNGDYYSAQALGKVPETDWGYNPISNGGNKAGLWITPSNGDWTNIITYNDFALGSISASKFKGLIIVPKGFVVPEGLAFEKGYTADYNKNYYSKDNWKKMEAQGACFIPSAGRREGIAIKGVNNDSSVGYVRTRSVTSGQCYVMTFQTNADVTKAVKNSVKYAVNIGVPVRLMRASSDLE